MARSKAPLHIRRKREELRRKRRKAHAKENQRKWWKVPLEALGAISAIASILGGLSLMPRVSLQINGSIQPSSPMKTLFAISNDGLLPIHDIHVVCGVDRFANAMGGGISGLGFIFPESRADVLSPGHEMSLPCHRIVDTGGIQVMDAQMEIIITYRPDWVWWHHSETFRVKGIKGADGTWNWQRLPE
jgi:hypothetical protein